MTDALARGRAARSEAAFGGLAVIRSVLRTWLAEVTAAPLRHA
ncbi:hypothetical protein FHS89_001185 [Rubricella aquisinus]|uniref:Uncharacterized protein n=1 Tax=Rubricella aquisinus TaxID=2028108 RepID=A0A840WZT6_9RHOB|nr:hypothetical protein [Rubricella aquisinus]MBB5515175.1 hypothetical protein [Rubricella aquisinus]